MPDNSGSFLGQIMVLIKALIAARLALARRSLSDLARAVALALALSILALVLFGIGLAYALEAGLLALIAAGYSAPIAGLLVAAGAVVLAILLLLWARHALRRARLSRGKS